MALAPGFAAGFAVQRLLEVIDTLVGLVPAWDTRPKVKKFALTIVAVLVGLAIASQTGIRVLSALGGNGNDQIDMRVTALVISAGTEGWNSIMKFLGYKKEAQKSATALAANKTVASISGTTG